MSEPSVAVVLKGYPRLSETFIAQELHGLEARGLEFDIWSLRHPTDPHEHPVHGKIAARRRYLPEYLRNERGRVLRAIGSQLLKGGFWRAFFVWLSDLVRARDLNRIRRFGQAAVLAKELPEETQFLYAHFLHTPASVTRYAAIMRGLRWGFSAHAKDIWTIPDWEKREKIAAAAFGVTCTRYGAEKLQSLTSVLDRVALVYHGLDLTDLPEPPAWRAEDGTFQLLSVGRLVEKKGYDLLLDALAVMPEGLEWHFTHIGGGELKDAMRERATALGLSDRIDWRGAQNREAVFAAMRKADLFVLPSRIAESGDRDGLPNVLMEAASQRLPVLSTDFAAIPEFVEHDISGTLVPPDDTNALAAALVHLARSPGTRARHSNALHETLLRDFGADAGIEMVAARIRAGMQR